MARKVTLFSILTVLPFLFSSIEPASKQRKPSSSRHTIPEEKKIANFDCPEEFGYYPHPNDCTQYYVCVFGGALLESCTGGLMYSHELQTCDWPRNVGCDGLDISEVSSLSIASATSAPLRSDSRQKYSHPPTPLPPRPQAVVTSRGQPRKLQHEIINEKQHQHLYVDEKEPHLPAEEVESDAPQRVLRGQPSTVGQVERDRDGLRHNNVFPTSSGRVVGRVGAISFGNQEETLQNYSRNFDNDILTTNDLDTNNRRRRRQTNHRLDDASPRKIITTEPPIKVSSNDSHLYNSKYDPYYALYDDEMDIYRDIEYPQHYSSNPSPPRTNQQTYRGTPSPAVLPQEPASKRTIEQYISQTAYNPSKDFYDSRVIQDYDDNNYNSQVSQQVNYRPTTKQQSTRGEKNELSYGEEPTTTKRILTSPTTTTTTSTTQRPIPTQKPTRTLLRLPGNGTAKQNHKTLLVADILESISTSISHKPHFTTPSPFKVRSNINDTLTIRNKILGRTELPETRPWTYKPPHQVLNTILQTQNLATPSILKPFNLSHIENQTSYNTPFKVLPTSGYVLKRDRPTVQVKIATKNNESSTLLNTNFINNNHSLAITTYSPLKLILNTLTTKAVSPKTDTLQNNEVKNVTDSHLKPHFILKILRKSINTSAINLQLAGERSLEQPVLEQPIKDTLLNKNLNFSHHPQNNQAAARFSDSLNVISTTISSPAVSSLNSSKSMAQPIYIFRFKEATSEASSSKSNLSKIKTSTVREIVPKSKLNIVPNYKERKAVEKPVNGSLKPLFPVRISRINSAIKSLVDFGGSGKQIPKCPSNTKCNIKVQRNGLRNRGSTHYTIGSNDQPVVNRGTPPPRSRPTLKPSTSIVSKAVEFIDIYKYPPRRPDPLYPQPQPDKTAAKCRKDVCLIPDCYCGGKDIPGEIPAEQVPQMVLLTFDDSVNDLNKGLYSDLFEKGRVNPNGCPISATFYVSHEWTDYSQVQNLYADGHEIASHTVSHSFGEQFSQKKWTKEVAGQREILAAYGGVHLEDVRGMRAPFLSVGGNKMFKMLYDSNFTYDSSMPIYENKPPSWPYTLDYKLFHDCMIPPCPTRSFPGLWEVPMVMWQDLQGGRCSMADACSNPSDAESVYKMLMKNFDRHYTSNRAPFGLFYHAAWFTQPHHKEGFINFLDAINSMKDVWIITNWQAIQWMRDPTPLSKMNSFIPFGCHYPDRPKRCNNPKVCNLWHKSGVRYMRTCQPCPDIYPWTGNTGIRSSKIDNDIED